MERIEATHAKTFLVGLHSRPPHFDQRCVRACASVCVCAQAVGLQLSLFSATGTEWLIVPVGETINGEQGRTGADLPVMSLRRFQAIQRSSVHKSERFFIFYLQLLVVVAVHSLSLRTIEMSVFNKLSNTLFSFWMVISPRSPVFGSYQKVYFIAKC